MTRPVLLRSPPVNQPLLINERGRRGAGEMAGGAAAECTAIFCCCPCAVVNLLVWGLYKVPARLCKKAIHKKKPKPHILMKKRSDALFPKSPMWSVAAHNVGTTLEEHLASEPKKQADVAEKGDGVVEAGDLENEMWAQFRGTGFWRTASQSAQSGHRPNWTIT